MAPYVAGLSQVIDLKAIAGAKLKLGVDPMGGASLPYFTQDCVHWMTIGPSAADLNKIAEASQILDSREFTVASDKIDAYFTKSCPAAGQ